MIISLCTTCMNRLEYLLQTIDININAIKIFNDNNDNQFEISLCNYDSKDGLHEFIIDNYQECIDSGLLIYTKIEDKEFFSVSHAKNIAYKHSNGSVLFNLDCDNKINLNILEYYNTIFLKDINNVYLKDMKCIGVVGISRTNFYKLGGYNEKMIGYGFEDYDFHERVEKYTKCEIIKMLHSFKYDDINVIQQTVDIKYKNHNNVKPNGDIFETIYHMTYYNRGISDYYAEKNIMNPNEFEGIEFGKI